MSRFENFDGVDIGLFFHARVSDSKPLAAAGRLFPLLQASGILVVSMTSRSIAKLRPSRQRANLFGGD